MRETLPPPRQRYKNIFYLWEPSAYSSLTKPTCFYEILTFFSEHIVRTCPALLKGAVRESARLFWGLRLRRPRAISATVNHDPNQWRFLHLCAHFLGLPVRAAI